MRLHITAFALAAGIIWGATMLLVAAANLIWPDFGRAFLELASSIYPGYRLGGGIGSVVIGTIYGLVDAAIAGAVFAWIYNILTARFASGG